MKKFLFAIMAIAALFSFAACNDTETYKDLRDRVGLYQFFLAS